MEHTHACKQTKNWNVLATSREIRNHFFVFTVFFTSYLLYVSVCVTVLVMTFQVSELTVEDNKGFRTQQRQLNDSLMGK